MLAAGDEFVGNDGKRHWLGRVLGRLVRGRMAKWLGRRKALGLCYHLVADAPPPHIAHLFSCKTRAEFSADLDLLQSAARPVSYAELAAAGQRRPRLPARPVFLSFDDGYAECFSVVRPMLLERGIPCIFFVTADVLDNRDMLVHNRRSLFAHAWAGLGEDGQRAARAELAKLRIPDRLGANDPLGAADLLIKHADDAFASRVLNCDIAAYLAEQQPYLTSGQLRQLCSEGFTIGAHGRSHALLAGGDRAVLAEEVAGPCALIQELTGQDQVPYAFPFHGQAADLQALCELREREPRIGLVFDTRPGASTPPWVLTRFCPEGFGPGGRVRTLEGVLRARWGK